MIQGPVAIILAAGHGKRMKSNKAKVLHEVCGQPMIRYVVDAARQAGCKTIIVVVGFGADEVRAYLANEPDILFATQEQQLGTGDAVRVCQDMLQGYQGPAVVLVGDEPLIRPEPIAELLARMEREEASCLMGTSVVPDPSGFGRIVRNEEGQFLKIVEQRDCTPDQARIQEVNPSCYMFELPGLWDALAKLDTGNAQGEYYLTDAPSWLLHMGRKVMALPVLNANDILGVNTRQHLAQAHTLMQARIQDQWMAEGVSIIDPRNTYIDARATIGVDTTIHPFSVIRGDVKVGKGCQVGPFAHLREGTTLDDGAEVGAFVEVNRSHFEEGARARHLAYLGDAQVGAHANIGATAVTANFDGENKHKTVIGAGASIGSGAILIAPTSIGEGATVGANAVVTKGQRVENEETVIGIPAKRLAPRCES